MKKTSIIFIILILLTGIGGLICTISGIAMGATLPEVAGNFHISSQSFHWASKYGTSKIENATGTIKADNGNAYTFLTCQDIDVSLGAATLTMTEADVESPTVIVPDHLVVDIKMDGNTLDIECGGKFSTNKSKELIVQIPHDMALGKLDLELGAGQADIGPLLFTAYDIELGAGQCNLTLGGQKTDYNYDIEVAAGNIELGDEALGGLASEKKIINSNSAIPVKMECAAGEIKVDYDESF